jgi:hypothetical protein
LALSSTAANDLTLKTNTELRYNRMLTRTARKCEFNEQCILPLISRITEWATN